MDRLRALNKGRRAQPVTQHGGALEIEVLGSLRHLALDLALNRRGFAAEEILGLPHRSS
jgi:hypothetical protein